MSELTDKQRRFVEEYLVDCNATQAAIRAGYSANGAEVTGHRLLRNPNVAQLVQDAQEARSERVNVTADDVIRRLAEIAFLDGKDGPGSVQVSALKLLGEYFGNWNGEGGKKKHEPIAPRPVSDDMDPADAIRIYREESKAAPEV